MRQHEVLYDWTIAELTRLADSAEAETFSETLDENSAAAFATLTEQLRGTGADLARAKAERKHFLEWDKLRLNIEDFEGNFPGFPAPKFKEFKLAILLSMKVAEAGIDLESENIDENIFEIRLLKNRLPQAWFSHENSSKFIDSLAIFSFENILALETEIKESNISPKLIFYFLTALHRLPQEPQGHAALVKRHNPQIEEASVEAFVRLLILASGKCIHSPRVYKNPLNILNIDAFQAEELHQQWNEVHTVLSEYNSKNEALSKYLTIYHVIENFMFKFPIVELERANAGKMFSIRDFRRLYENIDKAESAALKRLFTSVLKESAGPGLTFENHIVSKWQSLFPTVPPVDMDKALGLLNIHKKHSDFKVGSESTDFFTKLVYQTRCAIVHNKETEFHLTYASFDETFHALVEVFLLPRLEEICFSLIGSQNSQVWYSQREISLYN